MPARAPGPDPRPLLAFAHVGTDWIRGSEQCLLDLLGGVDRARFRPLLVCNGAALAGAAAALDVEVVRVARWTGGVVTLPRRRLAMRALLRARGAALVHANMADALNLVGPAAAALRVPVVAHLHLPYASLKRKRQRQVQEATAVVGCAEHVVAPLRAAGLGEGRVRVIRNAVNPAHLAGGDARGLRAALGIPPAALVAASVGSLIGRKAHDVTVRAVAGAAARGADVHLLVCGDGEEGPALAALADADGVAGRVHFLGVRADVGAVLRDAADVLVASAREEALPLNVLEAAWLGVPVVASDIPGHREALVPGESVALVPPDDAPALADALAALAADPARRARLGAAARALAHLRYPLPRYVAEFEALYAALLAAPRPPRPHPLAGAARDVADWVRGALGRGARDPA